MLRVMIRAILVPSIVLGFGVSTYADAETIAVDDPRPVAKAAERLEKMYGVPITYEDPTYVNDSEVVDVTAQVRRDQQANRTVRIPRGGTLTFTYTAPASANGTNVAAEDRSAASLAALVELLHSHAALRNAKMFQVIQDNGLFHIVPTQFVNSSGQIQQMQPLLDTVVSVLPKQRNGADLVNEICQSLSIATSQSVIVGNGPWGQLRSHTTAITASNEPARSVVSRLFAEISLPLSWQLFYDPGLKLYVFNIHAVDSTAK